jgi:hypothetical protein
MMKKLLVVVGLLCSFSANAHDKSGNLGDSASATDIFAISCGDNTHQVYFELFATLPKGSPSDLKVSTEVLGGKETVTITDSSSVDNTKSRGVYIQANSIIVLVNKNRTGKANFALQYHCESASGDHTDTEINQIQNQ